MSAAAPAPLAPSARIVGGAFLPFTLALANFMQVLNLNIANVSLPAITSDLGAAPTQGAWIITSYAVANAIGVPLTGWLADRFGQVRMFVFATLLFGVASLLSGLAWSLPALIACRLLQGVGAGFMVPLSQALLMRSYPPERQAMALTIWSMTTVTAPIVGPLLGGWITENVHWSGIFLINVPVSLACAFGVWQMLKDHDTVKRRLPLDTVGMALLVVWVGALQLMLDKGYQLDWFSSPFICALAVVAALAFALFLAWELTEKHPVVDLSLFRRRNFTLGVIAMSIMFSSMMAMTLLMTLWLQTQINYTALAAGYVTAHGGIMTLLLSPIIGRHVHRFDPRVLASIGYLIVAGSTFMRANFTSGVDTDSLIIPQLLLGVSGAFLFVPIMSINLGGIPPERLAAAASMQNFFRIMAGSFSTSLVVTMWAQREAVHHTRLAPHANIHTPQGEAFAGTMQSLGLTPEQGWAIFYRSLQVETYTLAANDISLIVCGFLLVAATLVWFTRPPYGRTRSADPAE